jgi:triphosphoribosyl-dephospho-CoA synthase
LRELTVADATLVYEAIRLAEPGGLGRVEEQDVAEPPTVTLREAMALAQDRDRIARQYTQDFADVLELGVPTLRKHLEDEPLETAIRRTHLTFLAAFEDSLILRKRGAAVAGDVRSRAEALLKNGADESMLAAFDAWLRAERLNPGTSADLVAASLFATLREGIMTLPWKGPWS